MITTINPLGSISLSNDYFACLAAQAAQSCYGVAALTPAGAGEEIKSFILRGNQKNKGVRVSEEDGKLVIELHIMVGYGLNIQSIVASISHRVCHTVERSTGLKVARINICVDDIMSDE